MSSRPGGNTRAAKYDYLIKLLLIGDSGKFISGFMARLQLAALRQFVGLYPFLIRLSRRSWKVMSAIKIFR
jgi:hypothetical protein